MLFCLVHGAWHDEACWQPLVAELEHRGHECVVPVLPLDDDAACFDDYAEVVVECLRDRDPPVLVGHSMSSAVIPLVAHKRPVRLLTYLCPAMVGVPPLPGEPPRRRAGYESPPVDTGGRSRWPRERAITQLYRRVQPELAERLAARLRPQPQAVFKQPYPLGSPPDVPSDFIYAREDELFDDRWSRWIARNLLGVEPIELPGGHFPMLEHPAALADVLETASGDQRNRTKRAADTRSCARPARPPN
jgi:pimeloyl-ACP methyl ester carboxylesterase